MLSNAERQQILYEWNRTQAEYPKDVCIHELFEAQVKRTPEATALVFGEEKVSYEELNRRANRLAHYLRKKGVKPEKRVGICTERSVETVVALLAVLKAGAAYVPLDPDYPEERLQYMVKDSGPVIVLTQRNSADLVRRVGNGTAMVELDGKAERCEGEAETNPERESVGLTPEHLAYVIYTSGSTGVPKGVMLEHHNAVNLICWANQAFSNDILARTLFSSSLSFDLAVYECFVPLASGGSLHLVSNALDLAGGMTDVTLINTVPSVMKTLLEEKALSPEVKAVNVAGEPLKRELVERIFASTGVKQVCNLYGPTETTTYSTWVRMKREDGFAPHIGRPIANTRVYVLDNEMEPAAVGIEGEIYIGGAGVARGYLNRNDLTAERFVPDPYTGQGERMYKTGDVGKWLADGNLEFLGRNDDQVKIRGFRIEVGEIAARLQEHPAVKEAVVIAREDTPGEKRLVAYFRPASHAFPDRESLLSDMRSFLRERLPEYMVPAAYVRLESLPLTPNGKLDRKALPAPQGNAYAVRTYEPPQGDLETALAAIWMEILKLERVGRHDDFFALGGDSLRALRVLSRVNDCFQTELSVPVILDHSMLIEFAHKLRSVSGRPEEELEKIAKIWLKIHRMTPEELKAALAVH
jgi:amino acid adenylation domain-containing protein